MHVLAAFRCEAQARQGFRHRILQASLGGEVPCRWDPLRRESMCRPSAGRHATTHAIAVRRWFQRTFGTMPRPVAELTRGNDVPGGQLSATGSGAQVLGRSQEQASATAERPHLVSGQHDDVAVVAATGLDAEGAFAKHTYVRHDEIPGEELASRSRHRGEGADPVGSLHEGGAAIADAGRSCRESGPRATRTNLTNETATFGSAASLDTSETPSIPRTCHRSPAPCA